MKTPQPAIANAATAIATITRKRVGLTPRSTT
jgi:hypothetical protein